MNHSTIGFSPFLPMFGRAPGLPIDVAMGIHKEAASHRTSLPAYLKSLREHLSFSYKKVIEAANKSATHNKHICDRRTRLAIIQVGDYVFMRNLSLRGKHKLGDRWEEDPCEVVECSLVFLSTRSETKLAKCALSTAIYCCR